MIWSLCSEWNETRLPREGFFFVKSIHCLYKNTRSIKFLRRTGSAKSSSLIRGRRGSCFITIALKRPAVFPFFLPDDIKMSASLIAQLGERLFKINPQSFSLSSFFTFFPAQSFSTPVKVTDFGIVQMSDSQLDLAFDGVTGSLPYLAPEQLTDTHADPRTDLYALGVVLYELLAQRLPFE